MRTLYFSMMAVSSIISIHFTGFIEIFFSKCIKLICILLFCFFQLSLSIGDKIEKVFSDLEIAALFKLSKDVLGEKAFKNHQDTSTNFTQTFIGLEKVVEQLQAGILNGPSITSTLLYLIVVPIVLIILWAIMCLLANWCCRPGLEVSVDPQSGKHDVGHIVR